MLRAENGASHCSSRCHSAREPRWIDRRAGKAPTSLARPAAPMGQMYPRRTVNVGFACIAGCCVFGDLTRLFGFVDAEITPRML